MKIDLTFLNTHLFLSVLASILFLNLYIIYIIGKLRNGQMVTDRTVQIQKKHDINQKRVYNQKKTIPKVNDDEAFIKRTGLKDEEPKTRQ